MLGWAQRSLLVASFCCLSHALASFVVVLHILIVDHVDSVVLGIATRVRAFTSYLTPIRSVRGVLGSARWQIITDSGEGSFAHVATLAAWSLLDLLRLVFRWNHGASGS